MTDGGRPRLVFAACRAPYPLDNGGRIRTFQLVTGLAAVFDVAFVTFDHDAGSPDGWVAPDELARLLPGVEIVTVPGAGPHKRLSQALSLPRRGSWTLGRYRSAAYTAALRRVVAARRPCVVHLDDAGVAAVGPFADAVNVYAGHNIERTILELEARVGSPGRRLFNQWEAWKVSGEERRVWRSMDLCLAVSPGDLDAMRAGGARRVELSPNGAEPVPLLPLRLPRPPGPLRLLFVGSGSYAPYERGLAWMVREVLPGVRSRVPVRFDVVGHPPNRPIEAPDVHYLGRVPDVRPHYEAADVVVVPVFEGSGTRLKVIEAMAYGRPVVSTGLGAEGLPVRSGEDFLRGDDADSFVAAILTLEQRWRQAAGGELQEMVNHAHAAVTPLMWPQVVERLIALYLTELHRLSPAVAAARP